MPFDPTTAKLVTDTTAPMQPKQSKFDPSTAKPVVEQSQEASKTPSWVTPVSTAGTIIANTAEDAVDLVLGLPSWFATMGARGAATAAYAFGGSEKPAEKGTKLIEEAQQAPWVKAQAAPLATARELVGAKREGTSPIERLFGAVGKGIEKGAEATSNWADNPEAGYLFKQAADVAMATAVPKLIDVAKAQYAKAQVKYAATTQIHAKLNSGEPPNKIANDILKQAAEKGIDTTPITEEAATKVVRQTAGLPEIERRTAPQPVVIDKRNPQWNSVKAQEYRAAADVLRSANKLLAASDPGTVVHEGRVAASTSMLAKRLGLGTEQVVRADLGALAHDIGKSAMRDIVNKQAQLTPVEKATIQTHPQVSAKILKDLGVPDSITKIALEHHETPTAGGGYPAHRGTPEFTSMVVETADIFDSLVGGPNSGHTYPLRMVQAGKTVELPRTVNNVIKVMDQMVAKGDIHPEVYGALKDMVKEGKLPHAQKIQLESAGEVPWKQLPKTDVPTIAHDAPATASVVTGKVVSPFAEMPVDKLATIRDIDRRAQPKGGDAAVLEGIKADIQQNGIQKPVVITVSRPDQMAYITDGNTRVTAAYELGMKTVPVKFEATEVPFTAGQKAKAKPMDQLGITDDMVPERILSAQELADKAEVQRILGQPVYGLPKELNEVFKKQDTEYAKAHPVKIPKQGGYMGYLAEGKLETADKLYELRNADGEMVAAYTDATQAARVAGDLHTTTGVPVTIHEILSMNKRPDFFNKQMGGADKKLIIASGLVLGGAALGPMLSPNDTTAGLLMGAALGFGLFALPKAGRALTKNWGDSLKVAATGAGYAAVGAIVDTDNPIEGILVGSVLFGTRFFPKAKFHPEDDLINARNGNIAAQSRLTTQISNAMKEAIPDAKAREELTVKMEDPNFVGRTPAEKSVVDAWRGISKSYRDLATNEGIKMGFIEGYVSHIIDKEGLPQGEVQRVLSELFGSKTMGAGSGKRFTKERKYSTFGELEKALEGTGLKLKTKDIAEITKLYSEAMTRTIENQRLINALKEATLGDPKGNNAKLVTTEQQIGYTRLNNPQLMPYYIHPDIAPSLDFIFKARNHNEVTNGLIALNRATKRMNVIGSFFHAKSLLEAYTLAGGNLLTAKAAIDSSLKQFREGGLGDEIDLGLRAGLRVELPTEVSAQALAEVGKLADMYVSKLTGKDITMGESALGKLETLQQNTFDKFTWDYLHTGLKTATYLRLMEDYKLGKKGKGMSEQQFREGAASHVNDTFGGLDWYRLVSEAKTEAGRKFATGMLNPSARDWLGLAIFAPDWTLSTVRAMSKALPRGARNPANAQLARQYAIRTAALYAAVIVPVNYALSGHFPWDNKDPTRVDFGDGTNMQVVKHSMEYAEWVREPWKTFGNKMGFVPRNIVAAYTGKQYPGGPPVEGKLSYVTSQVAPFTARSFQGDTDPTVGAGRALLGMFGISVYGKTEEEKAYAKAARKERIKEATSGMTPKEAAEYKKRHRY